MDKEFLLYIEFEVGIFTLVGGVRTVNISFNKDFVPTTNFSDNYSYFLRRSGEEQVEIICNGIINDDLPKTLFDRLISYNQDGIYLPVRLENGFLNRIEGNFYLNRLEFSDSFDQSTEFNINLISNGKINYN